METEISVSRMMAQKVFSEVTRQKKTVSTIERHFLDLSQSSKEFKFYRELLFGTFNYLSRIDNYLASFMSKKPSEDLLVLLRLATYELLFMRTPERAVLSQWVQISKLITTSEKQSGFINGVLRSVQRSKQQLLDKKFSPYLDDEIEAALCLPKWLISFLVREVGLPSAIRFSETLLKRKPWDLWSDRGKEWLSNFLESSDVGHSQSCLGKNCLKVEKLESKVIEAMKSGEIHIQSEISQLICDLVLTGLTQGRIWDVCAGEGRKTEYLLHHSPEAVSFYASDNNKFKVRELEARLGSSERLETARLDARKKYPLAEPEKRELFDAILVDAPCSALGVLSEHPEGVWIREPDSMDGFPDRQLEILKNSAQSLSSGGVLIYAVCTFFASEGQGVISRFLELKSSKDFGLVPLGELKADIPVDLLTERGEFLSIPGVSGGGGITVASGFYIACLKRK